MNKEGSSSCEYCYFHPKEAVVGVCPLCLHDRLLVLAAAKQRHFHSSSTSTTTSTSSTSAVGAGRHGKKPSILFALGSLLVNRLEFRHHPKSDHLHDPDHGDYDEDDDDASAGTVEDSFISIQFQDNGVASWEKGVDLVSQTKYHNDNNIKKKKDDLSGRNKEEKKKKKNGESKRRDTNKDTIIMPLSSSSSSSSSSSLSSSQCPNGYKVKEEEMMSVIEHGKPRAGSMRWRKRIGHMFHIIRWKRSNSKANVSHVGSKVEGVKVVSRNNKGWIRSLGKTRARE